MTDNYKILILVFNTISKSCNDIIDNKDNIIIINPSLDVDCSTYTSSTVFHSSLFCTVTLQCVNTLFVSIYQFIRLVVILYFLVISVSVISPPSLFIWSNHMFIVIIVLWFIALMFGFLLNLFESSIRSLSHSAVISPFTYVYLWLLSPMWKFLFQTSRNQQSHP